MLRYSACGENIEVTDALRGYVQKRLDKFEKCFEINSDIIAHINLRVYPNHITKIEMAIPLPYLVLHAEDTTSDMCKNINFVSERLERQVREYKTYINRKDCGKGLKDLLYEDLKEEKKTPKELNIVRNKYLDLKSVDAEGAALRMDLLGHDFFVFEDADTNGTSIVYRRNDSRCGLVETNE